jgi:peroxiredoxin Q/BCP
MRISHALTSALVLTAMLATVAVADPQPGDMSPDFAMQGSDGKMHKLSDYKGKQAVVIAWFPKAFTGGCTAECKSMKENGTVIKAYDVAYFTASCDTPADNKAFAESLGLDYPILSDPTKENAKAFGVLGPKGNSTRWTFYIDKNGKIAEIDKKIDTKNAADGIADHLKQLGVAKK